MNSVIAIFAFAALAVAQHQAMPPGMSHEEHMKQMAERGNAAMGFDQAKVVHRFRLTRTGGSIEVNALGTQDETSRKQIREHLRIVSREFAEGVFTSPIATHAETPPGVPAMQRQKARIKYSYEEIPNGARVEIATKDRTALNAVHEFLSYQIREHSTGDAASVVK